MKRSVMFIVVALVCVSAYVLFDDSGDLNAESATASPSYSGSCGDNITWSFDSATGTLTISGTGKMTDYVDGYDMASGIPWYGYRESIEKVVFDGSVTHIGDWAFSYCSGLGSITIPDSVTTIGDQAFTYSGLKSIIIPDSVISIGFGAFTASRSLASLTLGKNVESIGMVAFADCLLTSVSIPAKVSLFGAGAFMSCAGLTSIEVDKDNITYCSVDGVVYTKDGKTLVECPAGRSGSFIVSDTVTSIFTAAFCSCDKITSVSIPDSVTSLGEGAFQDCKSLVSFIIPDSIASIPDWAFYGCEALTSVSIPDSVTSIGEGSFMDCGSMKTVSIPYSVTSVGSQAFSGITFYDMGGTEKLEATSDNLAGFIFKGTADKMVKQETFKVTFVFADGAKTVRLYAKGETSVDEPTNSMITGYSCTWPAYTLNNADITVEEVKTSLKCGDNALYSFNAATATLTVSGSGAMYDFEAGLAPWYSLKDSINNVVIKDSVTSVGNYAFYSCSSLGSVNLSASVTSIGKYAFGSCTSLKSFTVDGENTAFSSADGVLFDKNKTELVLYPAGKTDRTKIVQGSADTADDTFVIPNSVTSIGVTAFSENTSIKTVKLTNVRSIGTQAFVIPSLESIDLGSAESIGWEAFAMCESLTSIVIPASVASIGECAFAGCLALESIIVDPDNQKYCSVDGVLFDKDKTVLIQYPVAKAGDSYSVPATVRTIGTYAFSCSALKIVDLGSVESIKERAFEECTSLNTLTIPDSVTTVGDNAFAVCTALTSVTIYNSVTSLEKYAFYCITFYGTDGTTELDVNIDNLKGSIFKGTADKMVKQKTCTATFEFADGKKQIMLFVSGTEVTKPANTDGDKCTTYTWEVSESDENSYKEKAVYSHELIQTGYTAATCTGPGTNGYWTCSECKKVFKNDKITETAVEAEVLPIAEHEYVSHDAVDAKCETPGNSAYYTCKNCTKVFDSDKKETTMANVTIAAKGHEYVPHDAVDAKCETPGNSAYYTCKNCTKVFDSDKKETTMENVTITASGHTPETVPGKAATCTETGLTDGSRCSVCGKTLLEQETISATGHREEIIPADDSYTAGKRCSVCGTVLEAPRSIEKDSEGNEVSTEKYATKEETVGNDTVKTELKKETDSGKAKEVSTEIVSAGTTVSEDTVAKAVEQLKDTVKQYASEGSENKTVTISTTSEEKKTEVSISKESLQTIKDAGAETEIKGNLGTLKISQEAAATLISEGSSVSLSAGTADRSVLTEEQSQKVGDAALFRLSATADDKIVSKFNGKITVTLPYELSEGKTAGDVAVYYINDEGEFAQIGDCSYADGYVTFTTDHFSYWAVTDSRIVEDESDMGVVVLVALIFVVLLAIVIMRMGMKAE